MGVDKHPWGASLHPYIEIHTPLWIYTLMVFKITCGEIIHPFTPFFLTVYTWNSLYQWWCGLHRHCLHSSLNWRHFFFVALSILASHIDCLFTYIYFFQPYFTSAVACRPTFLCCSAALKRLVVYTPLNKLACYIHTYIHTYIGLASMIRCYQILCFSNAMLIRCGHEIIRWRKWNYC